MCVYRFIEYKPKTQVYVQTIQASKIHKLNSNLVQIFYDPKDIELIVDSYNVTEWEKQQALSDKVSEETNDNI